MVLIKKPGARLPPADCLLTAYAIEFLKHIKMQGNLVFAPVHDYLSKNFCQ